MYSSTPSLKFLIDENVRVELSRLLKQKGIDFKLSQKSAHDSLLASISKKESRILITNDEDFIYYPKGKIFSVVWLRIPQNDPKSLITSFEKLLNQLNANKDFSGKLITLKQNDWDQFPLGEEIEVK